MEADVKKPISVNLENAEEMVRQIEVELELAKKTLASGGDVDFDAFLRSARFLHAASRLTDAPARW